MVPRPRHRPLCPRRRRQHPRPSPRPAEPPRGELGPTDILRLRGWVAAIAPDQRSAELRYAHGRHLFLSRDYAAAFAELDPACIAIRGSARRCIK